MKAADKQHYALENLIVVPPDSSSHMLIHSCNAAPKHYTIRDLDIMIDYMYVIFEIFSLPPSSRMTFLTIFLHSLFVSFGMCQIQSFSPLMLEKQGPQLLWAWLFLSLQEQLLDRQCSTLFRYNWNILKSCGNALIFSIQLQVHQQQEYAM